MSILNVWEDIQHPELSYLGGSIKCIINLDCSLAAFLIKLNIHLPFDPEYSILRYLLKRNENVHTNEGSHFTCNNQRIETFANGSPTG